MPIFLLQPAIFESANGVELNSSMQLHGGDAVSAIEYMSLRVEGICLFTQWYVVRRTSVSTPRQRVELRLLAIEWRDAVILVDGRGPYTRDKTHQMLNHADQDFSYHGGPDNWRDQRTERLLKKQKGAHKAFTNQSSQSDAQMAKHRDLMVGATIIRGEEVETKTQQLEAPQKVALLSQLFRRHRGVLTLEQAYDWRGNQLFGHREAWWAPVGQPVVKLAATSTPDLKFLVWLIHQHLTGEYGAAGMSSINLQLPPDRALPPRLCLKVIDGFQAGGQYLQANSASVVYCIPAFVMENSKRMDFVAIDSPDGDQFYHAQLRLLFTLEVGNEILELALVRCVSLPIPWGQLQTESLPSHFIRHSWAVTNCMGLRLPGRRLEHHPERDHLAVVDVRTIRFREAFLPMGDCLIRSSAFSLEARPAMAVTFGQHGISVAHGRTEQDLTQMVGKQVPPALTKQLHTHVPFACPCPAQAAEKEFYM